jgi:polar amino acid transport system substrate-binding protein
MRLIAQPSDESCPWRGTGRWLGWETKMDSGHHIDSDDGKLLAWPTLAATILILALLSLVAIRYVRPDRVQPALPLNVATGEWAPYSGEDLYQHGLASAVVAAVFREMGHQPVYHFLPWTHAEELTRDSESNDGIRATFPYFRAPERDRLFYFSDPILVSRTSLFYDHRSTPELETARDLKSLHGYRVLLINGYRYPKEIEALPLQMPGRAGSTAEALRMLLENPEVQLVPEATEVGLMTLRRQLSRHAARIRVAPVEAEALTIDLHVMFTKRNPHNDRLRARFNRALDEFKESGGHERLITRVMRKLDEDQMVILDSTEAGGLPIGYFDQDRRQSVLLPGGTRAVVELWDTGFLDPRLTSDTEPETTVTVRILNGPQQGQRLYVDGRSIRLP